MTEKSSLLTLKNASYVFLLLAIIVSGYLSYLKFSNTQAACVPGAIFDCGTVLNSSYSELMDIPIAYLGLAVNLIVITLIFLENRIGFLQANGILFEFGLLLFAFGFSMYLIYVQAFRIEKFCPWCLSHEAFITILFGLTLIRLRRLMHSETVPLQAHNVGD